MAPTDPGGAPPGAVADAHRPALTLFIVFAGPFVWILVLFVVELIVWFLFAAVGVIGGLLLGRPWQVAVGGPDGITVAAMPVRGRRRAHEHGDVVRSRLAADVGPTVAVTTHGLADSVGS